MRGNPYGVDFVEEMGGVSEVAGVGGGEWVEVMFNVVCDVISGAVTVGDYWSAWRDLIGDRPGSWVLMYFGEEIEFTGSGVVRSIEVVALFCGYEFVGV